MKKQNPKSHKEGECDCPYGREPQYVSRAKWICPQCKRDVSLEHLLLYQARKPHSN